MMAHHDEISSEYMTILAEFLSGAGEAGLEQGYNWGRRAIEANFGLLTILDLNQRAIETLIGGYTTDRDSKLASANAFLLACLAPYEMTHRGYRESVSTLQKLNQQLELQTVQLSIINEELEAFSSSVSHDLRAPLRSVVGFAKALLELHSDELNKEARNLLSRIARSAARMTQLVDELLKLAMLGKTAVSKGDADLSKLANEVLEELQRTEPHRKVKVQIAENIIIKGDENLLRIALENLFSNAWKFTSQKADATIEFGKTVVDGKAVYFIKDNGAGFDMRYADKLFIAFQRLHTEDQFEGTGVGLATVQRVIRRHDGHIWAESEVNKGTTFFFTIGESAIK